MIRASEIVHEGNKVMSWMIGNAVVYSDANGNERLNKAKSADKSTGRLLWLLLSIEHCLKRTPICLVAPV